MADRDIRNLLDAIDVAGKGCDNDAPFRHVEIVFKRLADLFFALRMPRAFNIRAVAHQREHAARAIVRKADDIDGFAVDRRKVHLEVARVNHGADGRVDRERDSSRNGVSCLDELHLEAAEFDRIAGLHDREFLIGNARFLQFVLDERNRKRGSVDGHVELLERIRQRADVVLVSVGDHKSFEFCAVLAQIGHVRYDDIDAGHIVVRKADAAIDNDHVVAVFKYGHVLSDFAQAAERNDL